MGSHKNVIEINGKLYDAASGALLHQTAHATPKSSPSSTVDGMIRRPSPQTAVSPKKPAPTSRGAAKPARHHTTQRSHTLMRHAVKKPVPAPSEPATPKITPSAHQSAQHHQRLSRAQATPKSAYINKFGNLAHHAVTRRVEALPVAKAPETHHSTPPAPKPHVAPTKQSKSEALFTQALERADHHTPPKHKKHHTRTSRKLGHRATKWAAGVVAALLLVGFIAYMNLPNLNMQYASSRAGFDADMPSYQPSGFSMGNIDYEAGQVSVSFHSNTDDRQYKVTQAVSGWNSEALQENFLNARSKDFQTTQDSGRTIYMYDNGSATWVNGGVWYQVESNQALSPDQLLKIASSL